RWLVGAFLVPAYYEREIYSPYDYMGNRLGEGVRRTTTLLFSLGGVLAQASRVYLTAVLLEVILQPQLAAFEAATSIPPLAAAVLAIGLVAVLWTLLGGIATVIWTDALLFLLFLIGVTATLLTLNSGIEGGLSGAVSDAAAAGKLKLLDFDTNPVKAYTFWAALIGTTWWNLGIFGTDQLMTQRMFCCKNAKDAKKAIVSSYSAMIVTIAISFIGIGFWAYYAQQPLTGLAKTLVEAKGDRIFPVFIVEVLPAGFKGLVVAGAFAAAISSLDSILAALSQTTMSTVVVPLRKEKAERPGDVALSRVFVGLWAVVLCAVAIAMEQVAANFDSILDLALAMATYTVGALIAAFFLAFWRVNVNGRGYPFAAALSVGAVYATQWHSTAAQTVCQILAAVVVLSWLVFQGPRELKNPGWGIIRLAALLAGGLLLWWISSFATFEPDGHWARRDESAGTGLKSLAFPWCVPIGTLVAFGYTWLLSDKKPTPQPE
ncbi:MAG: hypothetical protein AAF368_04915, partial [Planctomycetota bacterium]